MSTFSIPSSSGRELAEFKFDREILSTKNGVLVASVSIKGRFWERAYDIADAELIEDYHFFIPQVLLLEHELNSLVENLSSWLDAPCEIFHELGDGRDQHLKLSIGQSRELISQLDKPAVTFEYSGGSCKEVRFSFLVDRTCIEVFYDELKRALEEKGEQNRIALS